MGQGYDLAGERKRMSDRNEQSQDPYQFATPETLKRATRILKGGRLATDPDPILRWIEDNKLPGTFEDDIHEIRKCVTWIRSQVSTKSMNYASMDAPGARGSGDSPEPKSWPRYRAWTAAVIGSLGHGALNAVQDTIMEGNDCDLSLFRHALKKF